MTALEELKRRGLIAQTTHEEEIEKLLATEQVSFYTGFDATADSLHAGHLVPIFAMAHLQKYGHKPVAVLGTGTTMIGDPSGRTDMRKMLDKDTIFQNAERFKEQMGRIIDFTDNKAMFIKNGDWLLDLNYIEFLRDIGRHFSVNKMLSAECYKARLETGLSFLEFNYMLLQSYDFWYLFKNHNVKMQFGGDDQWSNLLGGIDLIRKMEQASAYAMTFPLLTTKDGKKMGKTQKGALWLDGAKCPPYEFYQYWRNVMDEDVIRMMKIFTFIPVEEIEEIEKTQAITDINGVKERFAFEITKIIHGEEEARKAMDAARGAFTSGNSENLPKTVLDASDFTDNAIHILDLLVKTGLAPSKREARTLVAQGGILIDGEKVDDPNAQIAIETEVVIKKGKKVFHKAVRNA